LTDFNLKLSTNNATEELRRVHDLMQLEKR